MAAGHKCTCGPTSKKHRDDFYKSALELFDRHPLYLDHSLEPKWKVKFTHVLRITKSRINSCMRWRCKLRCKSVAFYPSYSIAQQWQRSGIQFNTPGAVYTYTIQNCHNSPIHFASSAHDVWQNRLNQKCI